MEFIDLQKIVAVKGEAYRQALGRLVCAIEDSACPTDPETRLSALAAAEELFMSGHMMLQAAKAVYEREARRKSNPNLN
ncbi:MAG: hypothetical protein IT446_14830 [Phycisphaerales bacterium]|nr:hypothetical protein [Phycisphaerales bacterium]